MLKAPSGNPLALEFPGLRGHKMSVTVSPHRVPNMLHALSAPVGMPCLFGPLCVYVLSVLGGVRFRTFLCWGLGGGRRVMNVMLGVCRVVRCWV